MVDFVTPNFSRPVDLDAHLRHLPAGAKVKGMFHNYVLDHAGPLRDEVIAKSGVAKRRYTDFLEYDAADYLRLLHATAVVCHRDVPIGQGLNRIGFGIYLFFIESMIGKVLFGVLGKDPDRVMPLAAKGWQVSTNFGKAESRLLAPKKVLLAFKNMPLFLETYQIGVVQGAFPALGAQGEVRIAQSSLGDAEYEITWT